MLYKKYARKFIEEFIEIRSQKSTLELGARQTVSRSNRVSSKLGT